VRHQRFVVAHLQVNGVDLPLRYADLLVARHDNEGDLEWECVAATLRPTHLERGPYGLAVTTPEGRELGGDTVLVRSHDGGLVFRGVGSLGGFAPSELDTTGA